MITINNVKNMAGIIESVTIESRSDMVIDGEGTLTLLPALIDPHVHFRTPGNEEKEDWITGAHAAISGGVTTVFDMPNTYPATSTKEALVQKKKLIDTQLAKADIPLRYQLYFGADKAHIEEIGKVKKEIIGIKVYMGSSTGGLLMNDLNALDEVFRLAAQYNMVVAVHAEDEAILQGRKTRHAGVTDPAIHSDIRHRSAAIKATEEALALAEKYNTQLYLAHVTTKEEISLIRSAKNNQMLVYGEVTPHHLFLTEADYATWGTLVQMNPPLRTQEDQDALWEAVNDGTIDTIGSDHAPHLLEEKNLPYGSAPSGVPGVETTLPLLLNACNEGRITLKKIIELTRKNIETIFDLPHQSDVVLVDLNLERLVEDASLKTKCGWSPFAGRLLKGWPKYTIVNGKVFHV